MLSGVFFGLAWASLPFQQEQEIGGFDVKGMPPPMIEAARLTVRRCKGCHSMKRVLRARHRGRSWLPVVERMAEKPKASMTADEVKRIAAFLEKYWDRGSWERSVKPLASAKLATATAAEASTKERSVVTARWMLVAGGEGSYPRRRFAVIDQVALPLEGDLPSHVRLADLDVALESHVAPEALRPVVELRGTILGRAFETSLDATAGGESRTRSHVLKRWLIGRRSFRLVIALRDLRRDPDSKDLATSLALMVERGPRAAEPPRVLRANDLERPGGSPSEPPRSTSR